MDATVDRATETEVPALEIRRKFSVPREQVYAAWTDAVALAEWMGPQGVRVRVDGLEVRPGGRYHFTFLAEEGDLPLGGEFIEVVENERLVFSWCWEAGEIAGVETVVELTFAEADGGTEMILNHRKLPTETAAEKHTEGWTGCLACLADYLGQ